MDYDFYDALTAYDEGTLSREEFLENYPDDEEWLDDIDSEREN